MEPVPIFTSKVGNFAKQESKPVLDMLKETGGDTFAGGGDHTTAVAGLYRYKGTYEEVTNNFICLGDENPNTCKENEDNMYRIIGVTDGTEASSLGLEKGMLKVIKATPSNTSQSWASSYSSNFTWDYETSNNPTTETYGATARWYLNNKFYTENTIDARIKPYIANIYWWKGDNKSDSPTSEIKTRTTSQYRIGLMYASDYYNSWTYADYNNPNTNSWLHITHGLRSSSNTYSSTYEWTMTRYGGMGNHYYAWDVAASGVVGTYGDVHDTYAVRPVFYLTSNIELSGKGTEDNPFTIVPEQPKPALDKLKETGGEVFAGGGDHTTAVEGLYRYKGTYEEVTNNYICLGDENPNTCKENTDNMYRIIGVTTDGELKVIKATKTSQKQQWFSSMSNSGKWDASDLYTYLNGPSKDNFYDSLDGKIKGLIENHTWNMEHGTLSTTTGSQEGTVPSNIGLMYGSDYVNAYKDGTTDNWLFIQNAMSGNTAEAEWTMSRYGYSNSVYWAWLVAYNGSLEWSRVDTTVAVRPVFYLKSNVKLLGSGTENNPFTIYDEPKQPLEALQSTTSEEYLKTVADNDELLRYVGTYEDVNAGRINNFICFGTNNQGECTSNPDEFMYRIIGITDTVDTGDGKTGLEKGQLKIIKATPLKEDNGDIKNMAWANSRTFDYAWDYNDSNSNAGATLRYYLNNDFYNSIQDSWKSKITIQQWYIGDSLIYPYDATGITYEKKGITNDANNPNGYPIGLMYASDYYNSWTYPLSISNTNSWLAICHGYKTSSPSCGYALEWTMSRYGLYNGSYYQVWYEAEDGTMERSILDGLSAVRPVFYLTNEISISGKGTESSPFIISA